MLNSADTDFSFVKKKRGSFVVSFLDVPCHIFNCPVCLSQDFSGELGFQSHLNMHVRRGEWTREEKIKYCQQHER